MNDAADAADRLRGLIRDVPDFPKEGIVFKDITPILLDPDAVDLAVEAMAAPFRDLGIERVLGIESRGFLFGIPVARALSAGFGLVRKPGKLPYETISEDYELEYGTDTVEMHIDTIESGQRVLLVDDLIATGGTAAATAKLARKAGGEVVGASFLIELSFLGGAKAIGVEPVHSVLSF